MPVRLPSFLSPPEQPVFPPPPSSLGDLGTLLPLLLALTLTHSIILAPTLLFTGAANVLTGLLFGVPLPVQPMKAIAAVAIAKTYNVEETMASGLSMAIAVGILTVTGLLGSNEEVGNKERDGREKRKGWGLMRWVPVPVVKGIQMGAGLSLCISAGEKMLVPLGWKGEWWGDNLIWAIAATLVVLASEVGALRGGAFRIPAALIIFLVGLVLALIRLNAYSHDSSYVDNDPAMLSRFNHFPSWPRSEAFVNTLPTALGQLPLTTLNSILAVTHLASDLYPSGFPPPPSPRGLGVSISLMNLFGCVYGAMPACHGSGGLAGQHKFGARSGASIIVLGSIKLLLGIIALAVRNGERGMVRVLEVFPKGLLGVMVIAAGVELAKVGGTVNEGARDLWEDVDANEADDEHVEQGLLLGSMRRNIRELTDRERKERVAVMLVTVATLLAFRNDGIGFVVGMVWHWGLRLPEGGRWWRSGNSQERDQDAAHDEEREGLLSR